MTHPSRLARLPLALPCSLAILCAPVWPLAAQERPPNLAEVFPSAQQSAAAAPALKSAPLPKRQTLEFSVPALKLDLLQAPEGLAKAPQDQEELRRQMREAKRLLVVRVTACNEAVMACVLEGNGQRRTDLDEVVKLLLQAKEKATGDLKADLQHLLVAGLARAQAATSGGAKVDFKLWSFRRLDEAGAKDSYLCGPTIIARPGTTLLIPMLNLLDRDDLKIGDFELQDPVHIGEPGNEPHGFDNINLHTHGLNVSPSWPADDVFREIHPGQLKFYVYQIPEDHPIGTFWYHPHKHGAAGAHVSGGMAGALLVQGPPDQPAGLDAIGKAKGWAADDTLIFEQIAFYQQKGGADAPYVFRPDCFAVAKIGGLKENGAGVPALTKLVTWMNSSLQTLTPSPSVYNWLNGRLGEPLTHPDTRRNYRTGETIRLRLIHAGTGAVWQPGFTFVPAQGGSPDPSKQPKIQVIAWDGIPLPVPWDVTATWKPTLAPGNRADLLVYFPPGTEGDYRFRNVKLGAAADLAPLKIEAGAADQPRFLSEADVQPALKPRPPAPPTVDPTTFKVDFVAKEITPGAPPVLNQGRYWVNGSTFQGTPKLFTLGQSSHIAIDAGNHPIHLHVNAMHFEAAKPDAPAELKSRQASGLPQGEFWTDTLFVSGLPILPAVMPFEYWTGRTVVHCHILDHEDSGMMNTFNIRNAQGFPVSPLPGVLDMTDVPTDAIKLLRPAWPAAAPHLPAADGRVNVYVFLPRLDASKCDHCSVLTSSIADLRHRTGMPAFRIVAITGPESGNLPTLASELKLDPALDVLCPDTALQAFQAFALVDGIPVRDGALYTFPGSFRDGKLKHGSDLMHGLFVVDPRGFIVSANRELMAFDDILSIDSDVRLAANVAAGVKQEEQRLTSAPAASPTEKKSKRLQVRNLELFKARVREFQQDGQP